jgi:hypothetical protein
LFGNELGQLWRRKRLRSCHHVLIVGQRELHSG